MNVCIYSPYFPDHIGGGEKYLLDVALVLSKNHNVSVAISGSKKLSNNAESKIRRKYEKFIGTSLKNIKFISTPLGSSEFVLNKIMWTKKFDVMYYATDGSLFFSLAKKNILHIQIPFTDDKNTTLEKLKLSNWSIKNTNSHFTKKFIEKSWKTKIDFVHHPMISNDSFLPGDFDFQTKEKIILHVGRFFKQLHSKKQEVLVSLFKSLVERYPEEMSEWKLVFIGSIEDSSYARDVAKEAKGFPIEFHHSVKRNDLLEWYKKASIYWHATGFGVDQNIQPEKVEHFGISTVEAMASGCAPIVINKGGQPEVLGNLLKECLWDDAESCITNTIKVISDQSLLKSLQIRANKRAYQFSISQFRDKLIRMVGSQ